MKRWAWFGMIAVAAFVMTTGLVGCGEKAAEKLVEEAIEAQAGEDVDVDISGDSVTITGTDEQGESFRVDVDGETGTYTLEGGVTQVQAGANVELPADFPKDVPTYPGMKIVSAITDASQNAIIISATTSDAMSTVVDHFKKEVGANGWSETMAMPSGDMTTLQFSKGERTLSVMVMVQGQDTAIHLTVIG